MKINAAVTIVAVAFLILAAGYAGGRWSRARFEAKAPVGDKVATKAVKGVLNTKDSAEIVKAEEASSAEPERAASGATDETAGAFPDHPIRAQLEAKELSDFDWDELAELIEASPNALRAGDPSEVARLQSVLLKLRGKVPTASADGKGELTHPLVLTQLTGKLLDKASAI